MRLKQNNVFFRYVEHTCQDEQPLNSRDRFLQGIEQRFEGAEPLTMLLPKAAPLISPNNPGHSVSMVARWLYLDF